MKQTKLLIVGGVAGGATAAARARRVDEHAEIIVFEKGEFVSFANCGLPYYVGNEITEKSDLLVATAQFLMARFNIEVRTFSEVVKIDRAGKAVEVKNLKTGESYSESYDKLIIAPGASPVRPPLEGIDLDTVFTLRNVPDTEKIKEYVDSNKPESAVVVGGGFIGLEMAEQLERRGVTVTVVEMLDQVMPPIDFDMAAIVHRHLRDKGVALRLKDGVKSFRKEGGRTVVATSNGPDIVCDLVVLSIGVKPDSGIAKDAGLALNERGGVKTDDRMRTSDPDIYAVGDAVEVIDIVTGAPAMIPLAGPANKQARIAADNALGRDSAFKGAQGTAIVRVFDLTVASTGNSEKALKRAGIPHLVSFTHSASHASYYPGAEMMSVKLLFSPDGGKVLGAQIVGGDGVDKRIDVIATAVRAGMTVFDLEELELAYAPPFGSAKDAVNMAGFAAANILKGDSQIVHWHEIEKLDMNEHVLLDVRNEPEAATGTIKGSVMIPLHELRARLDALDKSKTYIVYCAIGLRGYVAHRILFQRGYKSKNLSGGFKTYAAAAGEARAPQSPPPDDGKKKEPPRQPLNESKQNLNIDFKVNACGVQCPGPIMKLKSKIDEMSDGQTVQITSNEPGFLKDIPAWCENTCNELVSMTTEKGVHTAVVRKGAQSSDDGAPSCSVSPNKEKALIVFSDDLDRALAAFIIANGAAAMGNKVTLFFTFWGLNVLRKSESSVRKDAISAMFGAMMPKGPDALSLSKMNMGGMGTKMMKMIMKQKNVNTLGELISSAMEQGVRFVACAMTMDIMGIKIEELIDGVEVGGVADYLNTADKANMSMFI
ncbi:MAG TPA: FAD-dependent oxidoreductase [bacterium]|nr:FAD-dependent oxidoreductase [bacterium]